jgi:hypothetical protein
MELRDALTQISEIRRQVARTEVFRGYRAVPVAFSGLLAMAAAAIQATWIVAPAEQMTAYLALWVGAAIASAIGAGTEMVLRARLSSAWRRAVTWLAIEQFLPCLVAGALMTAVLARSATESLWMLPGLWQILYSLGVFASCRLLPRPLFVVGIFYLVSGLTCLTIARGPDAFSPWAMGLPFSAGQFLSAALLYRTLERSDDADPE